MEVTALTWFVAVSGLVLMALLASLQLVAVVRPRATWTIENVYGGDPDGTDPTAFFAFNQGLAWADPFFWAPLQIAGSVGMLLGERWGFLLALAASIPFMYTAITIFIWDRDMGFRKNPSPIGWLPGVSGRYSAWCRACTASSGFSNSSRPNPEPEAAS